jgi:hypothetical protein
MRVRRQDGGKMPHLMVMGRFGGVTFWRGGAVSVNLFGHFFQVVLGDWWQPRPDARRARMEG